MKTKAAFNPHEHSRLFFLAGIAISLSLFQLALQWNGISIAGPVYTIPDILPNEWVFIDTHSENPDIIEPLAKEQKVKQEPIVTQSTQVIEVLDTKKLENPIKLFNPDKDPVRLKQGGGTQTIVTDGNKAKAEIGTIAEVMPAFPGGYEALYKWLSKNTSYPKFAKDAGIEGTVYIEFILGTDGQVQSAKVLRGIGGGCDEEVLNAIMRMPSWSPAKQGNVEVPLRMNIPFTFKIS
jgi:TonB family protein